MGMCVLGANRLKTHVIRLRHLNTSQLRPGTIINIEHQGISPIIYVSTSSFLLFSATKQILLFVIGACRRFVGARRVNSHNTVTSISSQSCKTTLLLSLHSFLGSIVITNTKYCYKTCQKPKKGNRLKDQCEKTSREREREFND